MVLEILNVDFVIEYGTVHRYSEECGSVWRCRSKLGTLWQCMESRFLLGTLW